MSDTKGDRCGIWPIQIGGWPKDACNVHDKMYTTGSWAEKNITRYQADRHLLTMLLEVSDNNIAKKIVSFAMFGAARILGAFWWEGNNS